MLLLSQDNDAEQEEVAQSLSLVKDVIGVVDRKVASYEKKVRLNEIYMKTDSKSIMRMKSGQMFAKEDLKRKKLVRDGSVFLKSATGRLKGEAYGVLGEVGSLVWGQVLGTCTYDQGHWSLCSPDSTVRSELMFWNCGGEGQVPG